MPVATAVPPNMREVWHGEVRRETQRVLTNCDWNILLLLILLKLLPYRHNASGKGSCTEGPDAVGLPCFQVNPLPAPQWTQLLNALCSTLEKLVSPRKAEPSQGVVTKFSEVNKISLRGPGVEFWKLLPKLRSERPDTAKDRENKPNKGPGWKGTTSKLQA